LNWFQITGNLGDSDPVPSADATFINRGADPTSDEGCEGGTKMCVAGFTDSQVSSQHLIGNSQTAANPLIDQPEQ